MKLVVPIHKMGIYIVKTQIRRCWMNEFPSNGVCKLNVKVSFLNVSSKLLFFFWKKKETREATIEFSVIPYSQNINIKLVSLFWGESTISNGDWNEVNTKEQNKIILISFTKSKTEENKSMRCYVRSSLHLHRSRSTMKGCFDIQK